MATQPSWFYDRVRFIAIALGMTLGWASTLSAQIPELNTTTEITQFGITWTFAEEVEYGQFVNGDYYVIGPVTVASVSPAPEVDGDQLRNGSMVNPPVGSVSAYDDRLTNWSTDYLTGLVEFPLEMQPGDSLVSSISLDELQPNQILDDVHPDEPETSPLLTMAVLTCIAGPVPLDTFRPGYADLDKDLLRRAGDIRWDLLPRVPDPVDPREDPGVAWDLADVERMFERPWIDHVRGWASRELHASENMPGYGREVGRAVSIAALKLMLEGYTEEELATLMYRFIQVGIDNWAIAKRGGGWPAQGGYGNGRKLPIVFAAVVLQDEEMLNLAENAPDAVYGEDQHTEFGPAWTGAEVRFTGQYPEAYESDPRQINADRGPYEHLRPGNWPGIRPTLGESYRRCCTSISWVGQALAVRMLEAVEIWNHDAFFAYVDRWMTEDDTLHVMEMQQSLGYSPGIRQGSTVFDPFVDAMWDRYRENLTSYAYGYWTVDHQIDSGSLGRLQVEFAPWAYSYRVGTWVFLPEPEQDLRAEFGAWAYPLNAGGATGDETPDSEAGMAYGYPVANGIIDTGVFIGRLNVELAPWVYSLNLERWAYLPGPGDDLSTRHGAWIYFLDTN